MTDAGSRNVATLANFHCDRQLQLRVTYRDQVGSKLPARTSLSVTDTLASHKHLEGLRFPIQRATIGCSSQADRRRWMGDTEPQIADGKVLWHFTMSLDGFVAGPNHEMDWMAGVSFDRDLVEE